MGASASSNRLAASVFGVNLHQGKWGLKHHLYYELLLQKKKSTNTTLKLINSDKMQEYTHHSTKKELFMIKAQMSLHHIMVWLS